MKKQVDTDKLTRGFSEAVASVYLTTMAWFQTCKDPPRHSDTAPDEMLQPQAADV